MSHSVFRFFQLLCWCSLTLSEVRWVLETKTVIFGDDVTLFCVLPKVFEKSLPRQWKNETMVVTYDEGPSDRNKYEGSLEKEGFTLTIKQFAVGDFRRNYTCSYGFEEYMANLTTENYRWYPQPGTYEVDVLNSTVESIKVEVRFQKVYPEPNCSSRIGLKPIPAEFIKSSHVVDRYFLATNLTLEYHYVDFDCGDEVFILCELGNNSETILTQNISTTRQCKVADIVTETDSWMIPVIVFITVLFVIALSVLMIASRKISCAGGKSKNESKKGQDEKKKKDPLIKQSNGTSENESSTMC